MITLNHRKELLNSITKLIKDRNGFYHATFKVVARDVGYAALLVNF
ncbi:TPA: hypothetical protein ACOTG9_001288 [Clostridium perfringens]